MSVRDDASANLVETLIGRRPEVVADPVWSIPPVGFSVSNLDTDRLALGISLRSSADLTPARIQQLATALVAYAKRLGRPITCYGLPFEAERDTAPLAAFRQAVLAEGSSQTIDWQEVAPHAVPEALARCNRLLGMRYHSLVLAMISGIPSFGLVYDPKVAQLLAQTGTMGFDITEMDTFNDEQLWHGLEQTRAAGVSELQTAAALTLNRLVTQCG